MNFLLFSIVAVALIHASHGQLRLYNAKFAKEGQFPYMGYLLYEDNVMECGVSVIHKRWLLTAAHCFLKNYEDARVTLGTTQLYYKKVGPGETYKVVKFYVHENFTVIPETQEREEYVADDVGLIRVNRDIEFNDKIKPISLDRSTVPNYNDKRITITGWGKDSINSRPSTRMRYVNVTMVNNDVCIKTWTYITKKYLCTSTAEAGVCYADSGSPLVLDGVQVGITCTADTYCESLKPDMHMRVSSYISWIEEKMSLHGDSLVKAASSFGAVSSGVSCMRVVI